jgi:hypothetical protein
MLPQPARRLVVGSVTLDGHWLELLLSPEGAAAGQLTRHRAPAGRHAFTTFELDAPAQRFALQASDPCHVVFVGYDA